MRKRASFWLPDSLSHFSHGKDSHTFKVLRISSAADGKQISPSHAQRVFSDATAWKCGCQLWNVAPHMLYPTWIFNAHMSSMSVDFEIFSPALCRPTQGWRQTMDYIGVKTARISHWLANKCFFLFWSWRRECPVFLAVLLESKFLVTGGECSELCISSFSTFCWG